MAGRAAGPALVLRVTGSWGPVTGRGSCTLYSVRDTGTGGSKLDLATKKVNSPLVKHLALEHLMDTVEPEFIFKLNQFHRSTLHRLITEAVMIETRECDTLMNSKSEWKGVSLPRVVIETGETIHSQGRWGPGGPGSSYTPTLPTLTDTSGGKGKRKAETSDITWESWKKLVMGIN